MCSVCLGGYGVWFLLLLYIGYAAATALSTCQSFEESMQHTAFGVKKEFNADEYEGTAISNSATTCPDLAGLYIFLLFSVITGAVAIAGAVVAIWNICPAAGGKFGETHPSQAQEAMATVALPHPEGELSALNSGPRPPPPPRPPPVPEAPRAGPPPPPPVAAGERP